MDKERIKRYILDFHERSFSELKARELEISISSKIQTVVGLRRVGKTSLLFNKIRELKEKYPQQIIYLNFEHPILSDISYKEIEEIISIHWSLFPETINKTVYLFVDEPQNIEKWELALRSIYDNYDCHIFITGSSSKLLSKEIATSLRGRGVTNLLLPLSFKEFLQFKGLDPDSRSVSTKRKSELLHAFDEYLRFGGYPELVLEPDNTQKLKILKDYFDLTIYKDIVERYNIRNVNLIRHTIDLLVSSVAKEASVHKLYLNFKSRGIKISKNTLYEYFSILEDSFFIFALRKFDYSHLQENLSLPKVYLGDVSYLNLFTIEAFGRRLENIIYLHLLSRLSPVEKIHYWKSKDDKEIDFIVSKGKKVEELIQVCYNLEDQETKEREFSALQLGMEQFKLKTGIVITLDEEGEVKIPQGIIKKIPAWKWLLDLKEGTTD